MRNHSVTIRMDDATLDQLTSNGFSLYALRMVRGTPNGYPVVWFQTSTFTLTTTITLPEEYQAYTSSSQIIPNGQIVVSNAYAISLGQTLNVTGSTGAGTVLEIGTHHAVDFVNETATSFTCGIAGEQPDGAFAPLCAFPLPGWQMTAIAPFEQVFLMFSSVSVGTGTVLQQAPSEGILVDLAEIPSRNVIYDISNGWSWAGGKWATTYPPNQDLVPILINPNG